MQSRREQLTPAVRARTIAAACDHVCLRVLGDDDAAGPQAYRGIYLDGAGAAYLVVRREVAAPAHAVRISCRTHLTGLGVLSLEGTCGRRLPAGDHPAAHHGDYDLIHVDLRVIRVLAPATGSAPAQCLRIGLADFRAAEADPWAMDTEPHRARLERDHQGPLRVIAALAQGTHAELLAVDGRGPRAASRAPGPRLPGRRRGRRRATRVRPVDGQPGGRRDVGRPVRRPTRLSQDPR